LVSALLEIIAGLSVGVVAGVPPALRTKMTAMLFGDAKKMVSGVTEEI